MIARSDPALFANIPEELKNLKRWCCWDANKVPVNPYNGEWLTGDADKMPCWTYEEVVERFLQNKELYGIGFRFLPDDQIFGIDADKCIDANGAWLPWAEELVRDFCFTYAEISPSGTGFHVYCLAKIPEGVERGNIEFYEHNRFFTVTGRRANGNPSTLGEAQRFVDAWYPRKVEKLSDPGGIPDYLKTDAPLGGENVTAEDLDAKDIAVPAGMNVEKQLRDYGLKFKKRLVDGGVSYDYHNCDDQGRPCKGGGGQPCLLAGIVHEGNKTNIRCSRFFEKDGRLVHHCFDDDGEPGAHRTRKALAALGIHWAEFTTAAQPEPQPSPTFETQPYPLHVWRGTLYGDYAEAMTKGNFIPPEFFIESIKTCIGAIAGDRVRCNRDGGNLRQLTVLIGIVGRGKGTATRGTINQFTNLPDENGQNSDYLRPESVKCILKQTGAVFCNPGSEVGLYYAASACPRVLLAPSEFSEFLSKTRIENSALPSVIRELFDSTWFTPSTTAKRKAEDMPRRCLLSMLTSTQPRTFGDALAMHGGLGSGLLSRLTLVSSEETRTVASLAEPELGDWSKHLFTRLAELERAYEALTLSEDADALLNNWWHGLRERHQDEEEDEEILTRLNVLTLRNALHIAWCNDAVTVSADHMEGAIMLGEYQLSQRKMLVVPAADNSLACHQMKIIGFLKRHGVSTYRKIYNGVAAYKVGTELHGRAVRGLLEDGQIVKLPTARKNSFNYCLAKEEEE
jgi:hypothetical protein